MKFLPKVYYKNAVLGAKLWRKDSLKLKRVELPTSRSPQIGEIRRHHRVEPWNVIRRAKMNRRLIADVYD